MSHLLAVRDRQAATDKMFVPLRDTVILLEQYGVAIPDQVYSQLEVMGRLTQESLLLFSLAFKC